MASLLQRRKVRNVQTKGYSDMLRPASDVCEVNSSRTPSGVRLLLTVEVQTRIPGSCKREDLVRHKD